MGEGFFFLNRIAEFLINSDVYFYNYSPIRPGARLGVVGSRRPGVDIWYMSRRVNIPSRKMCKGVDIKPKCEKKKEWVVKNAKLDKIESVKQLWTDNAAKKNAKKIEAQ